MQTDPVDVNRMVTRIHARRVIPASPAATFAFLREPHNHRRLATTRIRLIELDLTAAGELRGALMVIRGPLGLRRSVRTRLENATDPTSLAGTARLDTGTEAIVRWDLRPAAAGVTAVQLTADVRTARGRDRLLLRAGGRGWAQRLFTETLARLADELTPADQDTTPADQDTTFPGRRAASHSVSCATAIGRASRYPWARSQP